MLVSKVKSKIQAGFTLIELVVVIIIIGILAAVAIPKFVDVSSTAQTTADDATKAAIQSAYAVATASAGGPPTGDQLEAALSNCSVTETALSTTTYAVVCDGKTWTYTVSSGAVTGPT